MDEYKWFKDDFENNITNTSSDETKYSYQSDDDMRYMLVHELCHYIFKKYRDNNSNASLNHCIDPLFSKNFEEQCTDIMTAFILFPIPEVVKSFNNYIKYLETSQKRDIWREADYYHWIKWLSCDAEISIHYTSICYQHIRFLMNSYYLMMENDKSPICAIADSNTAPTASNTGLMERFII